MSTALTAGPVAGQQRPALSNAAMRVKLDAPPQIDLVTEMRAAGAMAGTRWGTMVSEIFRLSRGPGKLTPSEYFYYRLYDPALNFADKQRFIGKRAQNRMHAACNDPTWHAVGHDKLLFHTCMTGMGLPMPRLLAIRHPSRRITGVAHLASSEQAASFLRDGMPYPCFAKPIDGMYSLGTYAIEGYDDHSDTLLLSDGSRLPLAQFLQEIDSGNYAGYLFQERLRPPPPVAQVIGDRLSTIRFVVLATDGHPEIVRSLCKIPVGEHVADNYWRPGNMLGAIDLPSGRIERVISGVGAAQTLHSSHPDTGARMPGFVMPFWPAAQALCLAAASALPTMRTQAWDVALTGQGPVLVEVNLGGDFNLPQLATGHGLLDERFAAHLDRCGYGRRRAHK